MHRYSGRRLRCSSSYDASNLHWDCGDFISGRGTGLGRGVRYGKVRIALACRTARDQLQLVVSLLVVNVARAGDFAAAAKRSRFLAALKRAPPRDDAVATSKLLLVRQALHSKAFTDALNVAITA